MSISVFETIKYLSDSSSFPNNPRLCLRIKRPAQTTSIQINCPNLQVNSHACYPTSFTRLSAMPMLMQLAYHNNERDVNSERLLIQSHSIVSFSILFETGGPVGTVS